MEMETIELDIVKWERNCHEDSDSDNAERGITDADHNKEDAKNSDENKLIENKEKDIQDDKRVKDYSIYSTFLGYEIRTAYGGEKIQKGLRVMRPRSGKPPKDFPIDDYESDIGTVSDVTKDGVVKVLWDRAEEAIDFEKSSDGQYELLLYDNAPIGVKHTSVQCSKCKEYPLRGIRWKCVNCTKYNLCTICYMNDEHEFSCHKFKRILSENAQGVQLNERRYVTYTYGFNKKATVILRSESCKDYKSGRVKKLVNQKIEAYRSDAVVKINNNEIRYHVGTDGRCELKFTKEAEGPLYYEEHLPVVSSDTAATGARVVRGPAWNENENDDGGRGYVGTIVKIEKNLEENSSKLEGTTGIQKHKQQIEVKWDNGNSRYYGLNDNQLLVFDNGPTGVQHEYIYCDICNPTVFHECIKGFRWRCLKCHDYDLCNTCYMNDKHEQSHEFERVVEPQKSMLKGKQLSIVCREKFTRRQSYGIFKSADVIAINNDEEKGTVVKICDCKMDTGRSKVKVAWCLRNKKKTKSYHDFLELKYKTGSLFDVYHDHLPILGRVVDSRGHFEVDFKCDDAGTIKKIKVTIWRTFNHERGRSYKPNMLIIFADHPEVEKKDKKHTKEDKTERLLEEVMEFAKKKKLPCLVAGKKIMFYGGSTNSVFIHYQTEKHVIQELVKRGFRQFERGEIEEVAQIKNEEDEIHYFIRMAEYASGETVLPVIISLRRGGLRDPVLRSAVKSKIPIIRLKKHTQVVTVLTPVKHIDGDSIKMIEHTTDVKNPWNVMKSESKVYRLGIYDYKDDPYEISFIAEGPGDCRYNLDALVCSLIIGVSMDSNLHAIYGKYTPMYQNALSMYLLKKGKWNISKEYITESFNQRSIEYIYEQDLLSDFINGLWPDLENDTRMAYKCPPLKKPNEQRFIRDLDVIVYSHDSDTDTDTETETDTDDSDTDTDDSDDDIDAADADIDAADDDIDAADDDIDDADDEGAEENDDDEEVEDDDISSSTSSANATEDNKNVNDDEAQSDRKKKNDIRLKVSISELYGLIFIALLQNQFWKGAQQLIETGCIRIHHILIGCVVLENYANNWRTAPLLQERLMKLKGAFTQRAIRILNCIYEDDKRKEVESVNEKRNKSIDKEEETDSSEEMELCDHISHAGRLLLNHRYIDDAIKTENKLFLDNSDVKKIINKMWYGTEKLDFKRILRFVGLAVCHVFVLPLLMISMETSSLRWLYKQYKLPFMKVFLHLVGFLTLLVAFAYMLLFDYSEDGISYSDYFIITWMVGFFIDENKQHIIAIVRQQWNSYASDWWNRLDWLSMLVYTMGMLLKFGEGSSYRDASKVLLVTAFILLCIRILNLFCLSEILGPKLVMIRKMFSDTFAFMIIMTVIMMCYNISFHAMLYPNSEFSWLQIEKITQNGFWMLFGELNLGDETLTIPDCTFNKTLYETHMLPRCPTQLGLHLVPYLKAFYGLIAVIMLLNLLIAMYSQTFQDVQEQSEFYWSQLQNDFLAEYSIKTVFPIHLQLLLLPVIIVHTIIWSCKTLYKKCNNNEKEESHYSMNLFGPKEKNVFLNDGPMFVRVLLYNTNFDLRLTSTKEAEGNGALEAKGEIDIIETDRITILQEKLDSNTKELDKINERNQKILTRLKELNETLKGVAESIQSPMTTKKSNIAHQYTMGFLTSDEGESDTMFDSSDENQ